MKALIIGIDPGTTSAAAAVNFEGKLTDIESGRDMSNSEIIQQIVDWGKPVVIASDKGKTPSKVEKIARSVGAEIYEPREDLTQQKKNQLGEGENPHEKDASAAALNAYNHLQKEIRKIEQISHEYDISELEASRKYFKDVSIVEKNENKEDKDASSEQTPDNEEALTTRLNRKIDRLENQVEGLEENNQRLKDENDELRDRIGKKRETLKKEVVKEEEEVRKLQSIIEEREEEIEELRSSNESYRDLVKAYQKALKTVFRGGEIVAKAEEVDNVDDKAAVSSYDLKEELRSEGLNAKHVEEIKGIELKDFVVAEDFPEKDYQDIINEYRDSR